MGFPLGETQQSTRVLVLDQERLFSESEFGSRVARDIETRSRELGAENRRFESELEAEERALTELRPTLEPAAFRAKADEFNAKVQHIRSEQDAKVRALSTFRDGEQQRFLASLVPVLTDIAAERDAVAVLDRRLLLVAADSIDITDEAVKRVNELIGEGGELPHGPLEPAGRTPDVLTPSVPPVDGAPSTGGTEMPAPAPGGSPAPEAPRN